MTSSSFAEMVLMRERKLSRTRFPYARSLAFAERYKISPKLMMLMTSWYSRRSAASKSLRTCGAAAGF